MKIIGVVKDFNFETLKAKVRPVVIRLTDKSRQLMVRYEGDPRKIILSVEQRTKEIGVRKALGASVYSLTILLSKEFTRLVLIAIIPAVAVGWYVADWWLGDFMYRIELNPLLFVGSAFGAIVIAWATVSYQSEKAASSNPVSSLRYE